MRCARRMVGVIAALVIVVAACSSVESSPESAGTTTVPPTPVRGGELVVGTSGEVDGLNPLSSQWSGPAYQMGRAVLDPLVVMDRDGRWRPYLVAAITPDATFTTWTFTTRPGITFHNGEAFDAAALALFFETAVSSPLAAQGFPEKPVVEATGSAVTLTFTRPWSAMPTALAEQIGYVIAPEQLRSGDASHPIGTGPFVLDEWVPGDHFRAVRNEHYWRDGLPYLDRIEFRPMADWTARRAALDAGDVDAVEANGQGDSTLGELRGGGFSVIDDYDHAGASMLLMNNDRAPVDELRVRQAVVAAIDRDAFRDAVLDPSFEPADQPYPSTSPWHAAVDYPAFDLERAKQLVAEYEGENGSIQLSIMTIAVATADRRSQYLQQQLAAAGIDVTIESLELTAFIKRYVQGDYQCVLIGGFFGAADPDGNYPFLISSAADPDTLIKLNFARYRNPEVDAALEAQRSTDDFEARKAAWDSIWQAFATDLPYAFLAYERAAWVTEADVHGLEDPSTPEGIELPAINRWTPFYTWAYRA